MSNEKPTMLEEVDLLKLRLANRDVDLLETQFELIRARLGESARALQTLTNQLVTKYEVDDSRQINPMTGEISRIPGLVKEEVQADA